MKRLKIKIGDIFSVDVGPNKRYFQYVADDAKQLGSNVIRGFKTVYPLEVDPDTSTIINDDIMFYAHCVIKFGISRDLWKRAGNSRNIGNFEQIMFNGTNDYGRKIGSDQVKISHNWYVWKIGDTDFTRIGKLSGKYKESYPGLVINPFGILELVKGNKYPEDYPT